MADETDFTSYVPLDAMENTKTTIVSDLFGGAQAAVADLAGSTYNSLVPEKYEVNTRDMVARLGDNALRVYDEHPDAVHAASFIGGILIPSSLALKGVTALRSGMKGVNWFSEAGKIDQMGKINTLIKEGKMISTEYDTATRALYLRNAANTVVDNAAMELAIVTAMNAHPMMEDYVKDPLQNFGIGMMIGTAFTAPFTHIAARYDIKKLGMAAYEGSLQELSKGTKVIEGTEDMSVQLAQHQNNIDNWSNFTAKAGTSDEYSDLTKSLAESFIRSSKEAQVLTFEKMAAPEIKGLPPEMRDSLIGKMVGEPERFAGINSLKFANAKEVESFLTPSYEKLTGTTANAFGVPLTKKLGDTDVLVKDDMIYSPTFDAFMRKKDLAGYGVAADLVQDEKALTKGLIGNWFMRSNADAGLERLNEAAPYIDADFLLKLKAVDSLVDKDFKNIVVHESDIAMLNAITSRMQKMYAEGEDISKLSVTLLSESTKEQKLAGLLDIQEALLVQKQADILQMVKQELPLEVIRTRTNTPIDAIKAVAQGTPISEVSSRLYSNADEVKNYLTSDKRSLVVGTTASKIPVAQMRANIHQQMLGDADQLIKQTILSSSSSAVLRDMAGFLFNKDNLARKSLLRDAMAKINPASGGSKFWQSSDFWTRDMGDAGYIITELGKDSVHLSNKYTNQLVKPITEHFAAIVKDPAAVIEANTARELNASLRGYRELRDGQFFVQDTEVPFKLLPSGEQVRNMVPAKWKDQEFTIGTPSVLKAYEEMQKTGRELYEMNNSARKILGQPPINDLGFWMPALNPRDKYITYVVNKVDSTTTMLYGRTPQELVSAENAFTSSTKEASGTWEFVRKGADQARYNVVAARHDPMFMGSADVGMLHGGSSQSALVPTNINMFSELANGYEHYIGRTVANHLELQYSDVIQQLDRLSDSAKALTQGQPVSAVQKAINNIEDVGSIAKNTLLGRSNLKEFTGWQDAQNGIQTSIEMTLQSINSVMSPMLMEVKGFFGKGKVRSDAEWEKLITDMEVRGIPNPFAGMDAALAKERYNVEKLSQAPNMTARVVALSNGLAATALLKVMELGQPLVNMLSLPILTSAAVQKQFAPEFMGAALEKNFHLSTTRAMYDGMRYLAHPEYTKYRDKAKELGVLTPVVSEVSDILQLTRSFNPGAMQKVENVISYTKGQDVSHLGLAERLTAQMIELTSRPAVWSEQAVREISFATGVSLAKKAYPNLGEAGVITFARNFVDTAVGNYNPAQRPTVFQGTIGSAMGLFQTYMVTLGQQIYRKAELRDYKNLMKMALTQSSLFGIKSLPGFNQVSEQIGEHFSDGHIDLTTGMYQAVPEGAADVLLYGLPSNLGPAVYTRGDIQPRIPNILGGVQNLAAFNILGQAYDSAKILGQATQEMGDKGASQAFAEALSMQSISRPLARLSELATGHSVTRKGNEIAGPEEIYSTQGILARVFATRGLREAKAREAQYLDGIYKTMDKEQRSEAMQVLKNHIRSDTLTPDIIERVNEKYMRTGSATGWRSAVNNALIDTDSPGVSAVRNHLAPNSPVNSMIDDIE